MNDGERKLVTRIMSITFKTDLRAGQVLSLTRQKQKINVIENRTIL